MSQLITSSYIPPHPLTDYPSASAADDNVPSIGHMAFRRTSSLPLLSSHPLTVVNPTYSRSSWYSPTNPNFRARPEQLTTVEAVPLNAMTLAARQNDVLFSSVLADRLRLRNEVADDDNDQPTITSSSSPSLAAAAAAAAAAAENHFASPLSSPTSPSGMDGIERCMSDPGAISPSSGGTVSNLLLCAPIFESPVRGTMSLDLVSQNFGRTRLNRLYNVRSSIDVLSTELKTEVEDEGQDVSKDKDAEKVVKDGWRRRSTGWASVKSSVSSARPDFGGNLLDLVGLIRRTRSSDAGPECFDWVRSCGEEVCGADDDEAGATSGWQNKVFNKIRKGMRRHTVFWRG